MSSPQPYNFPSIIGRNQSKPTLQELHRPKPDLKDLISEITTGESNLRISSDGFLSRLISQPTQKPRTRLEVNIDKAFKPDETSNQKPNLFTLYEFYTRHAALSIYSIEQQVDNDRIKEIITNIGQTYWGYYANGDGTLHGYFGAYYPTENVKEMVPENTHTYFSILWPRHTKLPLLNRLRILAREGCDRLPFWVELVGAIAAADQALREGHTTNSNTKVVGVPAVFARLMHTYYAGGRKETSLEEIQQVARLLSSATIERPKHKMIEPKELDPCGVAFFLQELGKSLWSPAALKAAVWVLESQDENNVLYDSFASIADCWMSLVSFEKVEFYAAGMNVIYYNDGYGTPLGLWKQAIEFEFWQIPPEALRYLQQWQDIGKTIHQNPVANGYDPAYGNALAEKLLTEAQQKNAYAPSGAFRTALPAGMPIVGIEELCVWSDGTRLWVLPRPYGTIFCWYPDADSSLIRCGRDSNELSAWHLVLAALWHDLVTEGPKVIVRTGDEKLKSDVRHVECKSRKRHSHSRPDTHVLRLPSQRVIHMDGVHTWGTPEEIEKIKRQAHQVRGHRRKLLPGHQRSLYALENARRFNFIMPDGYTFVKPYQTGLNDPDAPATKETPILARGLASLMLMSKDYSKRSAAS